MKAPSHHILIIDFGDPIYKAEIAIFLPDNTVEVSYFVNSFGVYVEAIGEDRPTSLQQIVNIIVEALT